MLLEAPTHCGARFGGAPRTGSLRWIPNLSVLYRELPLLERLAAAGAAGFDAVELWWPFDSGLPAAGEMDDFVRAVTDSGVELYAMNLYGGDTCAGERGVLSHPERVAEFYASLAVAKEVAVRLGTRFFNAPYGRRRHGLDPGDQGATGETSLAFAARELAPLGGTVLLEPLSGIPDYPLNTAADALAVASRARERAGLDNLALLLDQYHLMTNGEDVVALVRQHATMVAHVQVADVPNRGEPGSGEALATITAMVAALEEIAYDGVLALEYVPTTSTEHSLESWRSVFSRTTVGEVRKDCLPHRTYARPVGQLGEVRP